MTRIRYAKTNQVGYYQSVKKFTGNDRTYKVVLNMTEYQWTIFDDRLDVPVASGRQKDFNKMKAEAKNALVGLGVTFAVDVRVLKEKTVSVAA